MYSVGLCVQIYHTYQSEYVVNCIVLIWTLVSQCKSSFKWFNFYIYVYQWYWPVAFSYAVSFTYLNIRVIIFPLDEFIINYSFRIFLYILIIISVFSWKILLKSAVSLSAFLFRLIYLMIQQLGNLKLLSLKMVKRNKRYKCKSMVLSSMLLTTVIM